jgi:uncharacterized Zn finger protein (UPF0148 family)
LETAEFKKGSIKWVATCPNCGSQFYQSKKAKAEVEKYLEKYQSTNESQNDEESSKPSKSNEQKPVIESKDDSKNKPNEKEKSRRLFSRPWRKEVA